MHTLITTVTLLLTTALSSVLSTSYNSKPFKPYHHKFFHIHDSDGSPTVTAPAGKFLGSIIESRLGRDIFSFRGIKYAKAPVGELRFKPPVPEDRFDGIYNATQDGPICPQPAGTGEPISEDCLVINVFSTKLPMGKTNTVKRPVIVYIHSGGFYFMGSSWFGPEYFMDQDIVLVTFNYRLGTLGFLATGEKDAPGNNAFKDQVLALKWVKNNIEYFGGDSDSITIIGCSAGGISVSAHMISPMSKGLFHRGVSMSDTTLAQWPIGTEQIDLAKRQARVLNCSDDTMEEVMTCLKSARFEDLGESLLSMWEWYTDPLLLWSPVVEPDFGQERFFTEHPITSVLNGRFRQMPFMTGVTTEEFSYLHLDTINNATKLNDLNENWETIAPIPFLYERGTEKSRKVSEGLKKFYFDGKPIDKSKEKELGQLYADSLVGFGVNRAAKVLSEKSDQPVFYYRFSYPGTYSDFYLPDNSTYGTVHHDDLMYLFHRKNYPPFPMFGKTEPKDVEMVEKLTKLYYNFAKYGNPTPKVDALLDNVTWTKYDRSTQKYLDIGEKMVLREKLYEDRYSTWEKLFPLSDYKI